MSLLMSFALSMGLISSFSRRVFLNRMELERKNHTLIEMARTMLDEHRTRRHFWADAISTAYYISN
jgi:hypothetical protein